MEWMGCLESLWVVFTCNQCTTKSIKLTNWGIIANTWVHSHPPFLPLPCARHLNGSFILYKRHPTDDQIRFVWKVDSACSLQQRKITNIKWLTISRDYLTFSHHFAHWLRGSFRAGSEEELVPVVYIWKGICLKPHHTQEDTAGRWARSERMWEGSFQPLTFLPPT